MKAWPIGLLFALVAIGACKPPIAKDIHCFDWHGCTEDHTKFDEVVQRRFPVGSSQTELERDLVSQGFKRDDRVPAKCLKKREAAEIGTAVINCPDWDQNWNSSNRLVHHSMVLPLCGREFAVRWSSDKAGKLTHVEGYYDVTCL